MFAYIFKNLKSLFTKQRLLAFLLVINIVVSCLVICFSYGLYQNYNVIVQKGEEEEITYLDIRISSENTYTFEELQLPTADIDQQIFIDFAKLLSNDTRSNLKNIMVSYLIETPLVYHSISSEEMDALFEGIDFDTISSDTYPDYLMYKDDADTAFAEVNIQFKPQGDKIIDAYVREDTFDDDRFNNGDKIVVIDKSFYNLRAFGSDSRYGGGYSYRKMPEDVRSVIIGGDRYEIVKTLDSEMGEIDFFNAITIPIAAVPENAVLIISRPMGIDYGLQGQSTCFFMRFKETVTGKQYNDVKKCIEEASGGLLFVQELEFVDATEIYYYKTIMLIAVVIAVLAAINMAILYRYILEKRSGELAIFRICGCSKIKAVMSYLLECMMINIPLFALTQLCYHKLIMPRFSELFPHMAGAYSLKIYALIFGIFVGASLVIMLVMIIATIAKHSLVALKSAPKATSKFSIMKIFEVLQLAAVLSIMVLIVSVIVSRYELYNPFKQYFERRGYMINVANPMYVADFEDIVGDCEYIINKTDAAYAGDVMSDDHTMFYTIQYSDEFIDAYAPPLVDGVWLSEAKEEYESTGYIPAVITSCDGRYKVGDVFEYDVTGYTDKDEEVVIAHLKYKIVGVLKDKISIASYMSTGQSSDEIKRDYRDIYKVFSNEFEDIDYLLISASDSDTCWRSEMERTAGIEGLQWKFSGAPLYGTQFVFCEDMSDDEYEELGRSLNVAFFSAVPLSEVRKNSLNYIYEQMYTLFPIAACIFILTIISTVSISAIYTKRQLRNYAIFYICGARWRTCALKSLKSGAITCAVSAVLSALILIIGKATLLKETVISFGLWHFAVCAGVIVLYLALSMIMPLSIIGSAQPREVLKEE